MKYLASILLGLIFVISAQAQYISNYTPGSATPGNYTSLTITGVNTHFNQASQSIWLSQGSQSIYSYYTNVSSATSQVASFYIPTYVPMGFYNLNVLNSIDGHMTAPGFQIVQGTQTASLKSITPDWSLSANNYNLPVTIQGSNTQFLMGSLTAVRLNYTQGTATVHLNNFNVQNNLSFTANIPSLIGKPYGIYSLYTNDAFHGPMHLYDCFLHTDSTFANIQTVTPDTIKAGDTTRFEITGTDTYFNFIKDNLSIKLKVGSIEASPYYIYPLNYNTLEAYIVVPSTAIGSAEMIISHYIIGTHTYSGLTVLNEKSVEPIVSCDVYPNPTKGLLTADIHTSNAQDILVEVFDIKGQNVFSKDYGKKSRLNAKIDLSTCEPGVYFVRIKSGDSIKVSKVILN